MMKISRYLILTMLSVISLATGSTACSTERRTVEPARQASNITDSAKSTKMKIKIGTKVFDAILFDNPAADAFKARLPLTLDMDELNGNEKKYDFSKSFPSDASDPKKINSGDLMIWGDRTLVLFYKTFPTSYSYTRLGRINDPKGLDAAVGTTNVTVIFELDGSTSGIK